MESKRKAEPKKVRLTEELTESSSLRNEPPIVDSVPSSRHVPQSQELLHTRSQDVVEARGFSEATDFTVTTEVIGQRTIDLIEPAAASIFKTRFGIDRTSTIGIPSQISEPAPPQRQLSTQPQSELISILGESFFFDKSGKAAKPSRSFSAASRSHVALASPSINLKKGTMFVYMAIPPDGGYGWFILLVSFTCLMIVDGILYSVGALLPYIASEFHVEETETSMISAIQTGCYYIVGPFVSAYINNYGFRKVAVSGAIVSIFVMAISCISPNIVMLIIFYSVIGGISLSSIWVPSQLINGYYFEKRRPIANGIAVSGSGAGVMIFSYINPIICKNFSWRTNVMLYFFLMIFIFCLVWAYVEVKPTPIAALIEDDETTDSEEEKEVHIHSYHPDSIPDQSHFRSRSRINFQINDRISEPIEEKPSICKRLFCWCCKSKKSSTDSGIDLGGKHYVIHHDPIERRDLYYTGPADYESAKDTMNKKNIFGKRNIELIMDEKKTHYTLSMINFEPKKRKRKSIDIVADKIMTAIRILFDFELLKQENFRILLLVAFLYPMGFNIPFLYSKDRALLTPSEAQLITPTIGFANCMFRIICGFIVYKYKSVAPTLSGVCMTFGGLAVFISAFYGDKLLWFQLVYAVCFALATASYGSLRAILYVKYLGLEKLTNAFGLTTMVMGIGIFLGTILGGILVDNLREFTVVFALSGILIISSGILTLSLQLKSQFKSTTSKVFNIFSFRLPEEAYRQYATASR